MGSIESTWLIDIAYAVAIGLFVGLEREHSELSEDGGTHETAPEDVNVRELEDPTSDAVESPILGVRTFALLSLLGWASAFGSTHWPWLPAVAMALVAAALLAQYVKLPGDHGLTTEVAAGVVFVAGMLVHVDRGLAVAIGLATTLLLISKGWLRRVIVRLRRVELTATVQLAIVLAIVLPLLPSEPIDPWNALPPRRLGLFVVLIAGMGYVGYFLSRILGKGRSATITGVIGGLVSSTATTVTMAQQARENPAMIASGRLAVFLANAIMFGRVLVITAVIDREVASRLALSMGAMGALMLIGSAWSWRLLRRDDAASAQVDEAPEYRNPFALVPALKWGVALAGVLLLAHFARHYLGDQGLYLAAAAAGLADVDAITLAVSEQASIGSLAATTASLAITIAVISNTIVKGSWAVVAGGKTFGRGIAVVFAVASLAGVVAAGAQVL